MNLVLLLAGCGCPTFEETEIVVTDPAGAGPVAEAVEAALVHFAEATLRDGVCVAEIEVTDTVEVWTHEGPLEVGGVFNGVSRNIRVAAHEEVQLTTRHELCHALDRAEGIVEDNPDLFTAEQAADVRVPYEAARPHEAFAMACEEGAFDLAWTTALADTCGMVEVSERDRFLAEVVYPGLQSEVPELGPEATWEPWEVPMGDMDYVDSASVGGKAVVLGRRTERGGLPSHVLFRIDPESSRPTLLAELPDGARGERLLDSDAGVWIEDVYQRGAGLVWDGKRWEAFDLGLGDGERLVTGAVSDGVLYGVVWSRFRGGVLAWDLADGSVRSVPGAPAIDWSYLGVGAWPIEGGFAFMHGPLFARFIDGAWHEGAVGIGPANGGATADGKAVFAVSRGSNGGLLNEVDLETGEATLRPLCRLFFSHAPRMFPDGYLLEGFTDADGLTLRYGPVSW